MQAQDVSWNPGKAGEIFSLWPLLLTYGLNGSIINFKNNL